MLSYVMLNLRQVVVNTLQQIWMHSRINKTSGEKKRETEGGRVRKGGKEKRDERGYIRTWEVGGSK